MISVALACYNGEKFIKEQIYSILNQKDVELEIVICDDCSTDNTVKIIKEIQKEDQRVFLFENEKQLGVVKNFEKAIGLCKGEFIALSDQDDVWNENKLKIQLLELSKYDEFDKPILIAHDLEIMSYDLKTSGGSFWEKFKIKFSKKPFNCFFSNSLTGCTVFTRTDDLKKALPFEECILHDHQIYIYYQVFGDIKPIKNKLIQFRRHESNVTTTTKLNLIDRFFNIFTIPFMEKEKYYFNCFQSRYKTQNSNSYLFIRSTLKMPALMFKLFHILYTRINS
jgi:glycosyltransferase involved in cell wall biosynthesis